MKVLTYQRSRSSALALALAFAGAGVLGIGAFETPAYAQKKAKEDKRAAKQDYSKEFVAVYEPLAKQINAGGDAAAMKGQVPSLAAAATTADDRMAAGGLILQIGQKSSDPALQRQGLEMMLASGKVAAENLGQYNFFAGQLAYNAREFAKARQFFEQALANGSQDNPEALIAETYFQENNFNEGLAYLSRAIAAQRAAGKPVDEAWIKRGMSVAYNNQLAPQASEYGLMFVENYPTPSNWADVIIIQTQQNLANPEILDLMRLAREAKAMREESFFADYVDAADYRRLPGEVVAVIDEGYASGKIVRNKAFMDDLRTQAQSRVAGDRKELPGIIRTAQGSSDMKTVLAAADMALGYGDYAAAETLYRKLADMPGADKGLVQTRLGIAQYKQGKVADAKTTFDAVTGPRASIAKLWSVLASQQGA